MLYHMTKAADGTRLCSFNDGVEQLQTDICVLHDYATDNTIMVDHFGDHAQVEKIACDWRPCYVQGEKRTGDEAFAATEYGGIAFTNMGLQDEMGGMNTWEYHGNVTDAERFFKRFQDVNDAIRKISCCRGFCYKQLTDVMLEINGLLTQNRQAKVNVKRFAQLNANPPGLSNQMI